jgi:tetratricopeptide (TPR) repeat protein
LGIKAFDLYSLGDSAQSQACAEMSLALSREIGDSQGEAFCLYTLATLQEDSFSMHRLLEQSLALYRMLGDKAGQAKILSELGHSYGDGSERALAFAKESLALYREVGDPINVFAQLTSLASLFTQNEDYAAARKLMEEALPMQRQLGLKNEIPYGLAAVGRLAFWQGDLKQARACFEESVVLSDETGQFPQGFWPRAQLAYVLLRQGEIAPARLEFVDSLNRSRTVGGVIGTVFVLEGLASLAVAESQLERAASLFAWADSMRQTNDYTRPANERTDVDRDLSAIRLRLDEAALQVAQAAGRAMTLEEAVAFALSDRDL